MNTKPTHPLRMVQCCYCGARSTFGRLPDGRLLCHGCGAPITRMTSEHADAEKRHKTAKGPKAAIPHPARTGSGSPHRDTPLRRRKGKRRRTLWYHLKEAFDEIEDLFD